MTGINKIAGRVLLVDDDSLVAMNERSCLETAGFVVERADTLRQAIRLLERQRFDLILLDHDLPDGKGRSLIVWLEEQKMDISVIYLSAAPPAILQEIGRMSRVHAVLAKPVDRGQLVEAVRLNMPDVVEPLYPRLIDMEERRLLLSLLQS